MRATTPCSEMPDVGSGAAAGDREPGCRATASLGDLPPPETRRWVARRKAQVVAAVRAGTLEPRGGLRPLQSLGGGVRGLGAGDRPARAGRACGSPGCRSSARADGRPPQRRPAVNRSFTVAPLASPVSSRRFGRGWGAWNRRQRSSQVAVPSRRSTRGAGRGAAGRAGPGARGRARILALGAVACCLLGFFAYVIAPRRRDVLHAAVLRPGARPTRRNWSAGWRRWRCRIRLSPGGDAIMVPGRRCAAAAHGAGRGGHAGGGTVGYELFDRANPFTTSDFLGNVNLRRAVEGELARTIGTLRGVRSARVHIVEPKRSLFGREEVKPTASIVLALRGAAAAGQAAGGRHPPSGGGRGAGPAPPRPSPSSTSAATCWPSRPGPGAEPAPTAIPKISGCTGKPPARQGRSSCSSGRSAPARRMRPSVPISTSTSWRPRPSCTIRKARWCAAPRPPTRPATRRRTQATGGGERRQQPADRAGGGGPGRRPPASSTKRPRRPSTTRSRAPSATRPSGAPRCASCRSRCRSTASIATSRTGPDPTSRAAPRSWRSSAPWCAAPPASTRAAATWSRWSAGSLPWPRPSRPPTWVGRPCCPSAMGIWSISACSAC